MLRSSMTSSQASISCSAGAETTLESRVGFRFVSDASYEMDAEIEQSLIPREKARRERTIRSCLSEGRVVDMSFSRRLLESSDGWTVVAWSGAVAYSVFLGFPVFYQEPSRVWCVSGPPRVPACLQSLIVSYCQTSLIASSPPTPPSRLQ